MCFFIAPSLILPPNVSFEFSLSIRLCERRFGYLQGVVFMENFWNLKAIQNIKNHFDIGLRKTCYEEIQVIPMDMSS